MGYIPSDLWGYTPDLWARTRASPILTVRSKSKTQSICMYMTVYAVYVLDLHSSTSRDINAGFQHFHQAKFQQIHQCLPGHDARVHRLWHLGEGAHWSIATRQHGEPGFRLMNGQCNQHLQFEASHACAKGFVQNVVRINCRNDRIMSECSQ